MPSPKYHLITYGCQMNKNDSERLSGLLRGLGFEPTSEKEQADIILLNTCSVRQSAENRVYGHMSDFSKMKEKRPNLIIGITGCMPGRDRNFEFKKKMPVVDLYFPTSQMGQLPRWIAELRPDLVNSADIVDDYTKIMPHRETTRQAYVSIQTGCNKFCSYCVVPFARGLEKNRSVEDILSEIKELVSKGCVEITLLGQTVNSYRAPDSQIFSDDNPYGDHFAALLWEINQIPEIKRMHFTAPHPVHMTDEVIDAMALPAHVNFLHLPVQSGDDLVLRKMNRRYSSEQFLNVIDKVKKRIPDIAIGTDIIVGFSGESKEAFEKTVELYKKVNFDIAYIAQYSVRSGTAAFRAFKDDVLPEEKKRRWKVLQSLMEKIVFEKNQKFVGQIVSVLVDRFESGFCYGNSREMKLVRFLGNQELVGRIVDVSVTQSDIWLLEGENMNVDKISQG
ncbi:tRNA (N6-isopentenyl adenosine(37)-C2)-methylthiotransferase MiaB [Candidatus Uhrbacteria bacterium]|nr:tRNA (N6-isopentenyl adenosine(37)-C2)-methylthiotransferase MiaB [Candidatus Uhrbacteria bacterium]